MLSFSQFQFFREMETDDETLLIDLTHDDVDALADVEVHIPDKPSDRVVTVIQAVQSVQVVDKTVQTVAQVLEQVASSEAVHSAQQANQQGPMVQIPTLHSEEPGEPAAHPGAQAGTSASPVDETRTVKVLSDRQLLRRKQNALRKEFKGDVDKEKKQIARQRQRTNRRQRDNEVRAIYNTPFISTDADDEQNNDGELPPNSVFGKDIKPAGYWSDEDMDDDNYDEETYCPYVYSMEGDPVNWQERCIELEMSLQRFRDQAGKIRGLLREKVSHNQSTVSFHLVLLCCGRRNSGRFPRGLLLFFFCIPPSYRSEELFESPFYSVSIRPEWNPFQKRTNVYTERGVA